MNYLEQKGLIGQHKGTIGTPEWTVSIREEGQVFLADGGFQKEQELRNLPFVTVKAAKASRKLSIIAIFISIIAILVRLIWH